MAATSVYLGVDVACALGKRLPICVVSAGSSLLPLPIPKHLAALIPRGVGNREIIADTPFAKTARDAVEAVTHIVGEMKWKVERIAIDAPAAPPQMNPRQSEDELTRFGLSSFRTPASHAWADIRGRCGEHIRLGGTVTTLPHANKIWMLFGFQLFENFRRSNVEVLEVYPYAIVRALLPTCEHKSTEAGYRHQLAAVATRTGWEASNLERELRATVPGHRHDRLDAFMAAWVASLPRQERRVYGNEGCSNDAIWVPA